VVEEGEGMNIECETLKRREQEWVPCRAEAKFFTEMTCKENHVDESTVCSSCAIDLVRGELDCWECGKENLEVMVPFVEIQLTPVDSAG
jgi:hypothetical protein